MGKFLLRWTNSDVDEPCLIDEPDALHCINAKEPGQLYFMMGFPAMVLLELATSSSDDLKVRADEYRETAQTIIDFLKTCEGIWTSPMAHKFGMAAAMAGDE